MIDRHHVPIILEEACVADVSEITEVHLSAEQSIYPDTEQHFALPALEEIEEYHTAGNASERWRAAREREIFYDHHKRIQVARLGGAVVGFSVYDSQINWLNSLYVAPEYQGYGIGSRLLKNCLQTAGANPTRLLTVEHSAAVDFYKKHGFTLGESAPKRRRTRVNTTIYIPLIGMIYEPETTAV
jgi:ribosomal protein S18 acetylase RimI-like enzyme